MEPAEGDDFNWNQIDWEQDPRDPEDDPEDRGASVGSTTPSVGSTPPTESSYANSTVTKDVDGRFHCPAPGCCVATTRRDNLRSHWRGQHPSLPMPNDLEPRRPPPLLPNESKDERQKRLQRARRQLPHNKASQQRAKKRYEASDAGRAAKARRQSAPAAKAIQKRYRRSTKGRHTRTKVQQTYQNGEKGKATGRRGSKQYRAKMRALAIAEAVARLSALSDVGAAVERLKLYINACIAAGYYFYIGITGERNLWNRLARLYVADQRVIAQRLPNARVAADSERLLTGLFLNHPLCVNKVHGGAKGRMARNKPAYLYVKRGSGVLAVPGATTGPVVFEPSTPHETLTIKGFTEDEVIAGVGSDGSACEDDSSSSSGSSNGDSDSDSGSDSDGSSSSDDEEGTDGPKYDVSDAIPWDDDLL